MVSGFSTSQIALCHLGGRLLLHRSARAVNHTHACDGNILLSVSPEQTFGIVVRRGHADQHSAFLQLDSDIGFEFHAARQVAAYPQNERTPTLLADVVDSILQRARVDGHTIGTNAEIGTVIDAIGMIIIRLGILSLHCQHPYQQSAKQSHYFLHNSIVFSCFHYFVTSTEQLDTLFVITCCLPLLAGSSIFN